MKPILFFLVAFAAVFSACIPASHATGIPKKPATGAVTIRLHYPQLAATDTLALYYLQSPILSKYSPEQSYPRVTSIRDKAGWVSFSFQPVSNVVPLPTYIKIEKLRSARDRADTSQVASHQVDYNILEGYLVEPGDRITVEVRPLRELVKASSFGNFHLRFSGPQSRKYNLRYRVDSLNYHADVSGALLNDDLTYKTGNFANRELAAELALVPAVGPDVSAYARQELICHIIGRAKAEEALVLHYEIKKKFVSADEDLKQRFLTSYTNFNKSYWQALPLAACLGCYDYSFALLKRREVFATVKYGLAYRAKVYDEILETDTGRLQEHTLLAYLSLYGIFLKDFAGKIKEAGMVIRAPVYAAEMEALQRKSIGAAAFPFELPDATGRMVRLRDFQGKIVVVDFWYTGCGSCIEFYQEHLSKVEQKYAGDSTVVFLTICVDKDRKFWLRSIASGQYTSPHIVNLYTAGQGSAAEVIKYYGVHSFPQPMLIGKDQRMKDFSYNLRSVEGLTQAIEHSR
jgi:cytochrome oxidase Cu insertion factor (SCO1/SenC/PrrC family)